VQLAENSRRAYLSDLAEFERWGGSIPASIETVAAYLAARADALAVATLVRHVASVSKAHQALGLPNPTRSELVRATLRGIKRTRGCAQREAKPLLRDDLLLVLDAMGDSIKDTRDRALLLIGFAGAWRCWRLHLQASWDTWKSDQWSLLTRWPLLAASLVS
jgi:hypothetical protein